jgi:hypothetical protein
MRIRMLKPFRALKAGVVLKQTDGVAEMWIHSGRAERMVPEETVDVAVTSEPRRQRRKRREALA